MLNEGDKIRLIHYCHTALLNRMFDELSREPGSSAEQVAVPQLCPRFLTVSNVAIWRQPS